MPATKAQLKSDIRSALSSRSLPTTSFADARTTDDLDALCDALATFVAANAGAPDRTIMEFSATAPGSGSGTAAGFTHTGITSSLTQYNAIAPFNGTIVGVDLYTLGTVPATGSGTLSVVIEGATSSLLSWSWPTAYVSADPSIAVTRGQRIRLEIQKTLWNVAATNIHVCLQFQRS